MKYLDCTLRDGGYYTNWDFEKETVNTYLESMNQLPIDYLEIGYRSNPLPGYLGEFFYCPVPVMEKVKEISNKKLVIMLNEKDVTPSHAEALLLPCKGLIDMVRVAVDPANFKRALKLAEKVKELGFDVGFNVMYMSTWAERKEFLTQIKEVEGLINYFYMVDSFGGVYPEDVKNTIQLVRSQTSTPIGFHGHNNLELGLINTLTAMDNGVEIVDATITGMGRGAGNLKTELLLTVLSSQGKLNFDFNALSKAEDLFSKLQKKHEWGTNLPYMVSGANSHPQKQVMEWVSKRYFSFNSIIRALSNQSKGIEDNLKLPVLEFNKEKQYSAALIVGGGPSVVKQQDSIEQYLKQNPNIVVIHASSRNAMCFESTTNDQYFCLVGNEGHRMEEVFGDTTKVKGKCVLPPFPRKMGTYVPSLLKDKAYELSEVSFTTQFKNTHTSLAMQTAIELSIKDVFIVGYDGYSGESMGQKEQEFFMENEYLFDQAGKRGLNCRSLTLTQYNNIKQKSIFEYI